MACLALGYEIRSHYQSVAEAVFPEERREFQEDIVRPDSIKDVREAVDELVKVLLKAGGECDITRVRAVNWGERLSSAANRDDDADAREVLGEIQNWMTATSATARKSV